MSHFIKNILLAVRTKNWRVLFTFFWIAIQAALGIKLLRIFGFKFQTYKPLNYLRHFEDAFIQHQYFFKSKNKRPVILDCGANIGDTVLYFKSVYPKAIITSFEADTKSFELLKRNTERNFSDVTIHNVALWKKNENVNFYMDPNDPGSGLGSLFQSVYKKRRSINTKINIPGRKLSDFILGKVDLLKMDIEGGEDLVIGELAEANQLNKVDQIILEYHHHHASKEDKLSKLLKILEDHNFTYSLSTGLNPPFEPGEFQDILIFAKVI